MEKLTKFNTLNHDYTSFPPKLWELDILDFAAPNIIQANDTLYSLKLSHFPFSFAKFTSQKSLRASKSYSHFVQLSCTPVNHLVAI